ncbi:MAG: AAA family ATPase [Hyphomicrobiaceae bacterium]
MQEIIIVAGPNGAGKTSFANEYLSAAEEDLAYVNADEIARGLALQGLAGTALDVASAGALLGDVERLVASRAEFMLETTLATLTYAPRIGSWRKQGYWVSLIYLRLPSVEVAIERVQRRVRAGGHSIPTDVVRRRFSRSLQYLERIYKPIVDDWSIWDSLEGDFRLAATSDD